MNKGYYEKFIQYWREKGVLYALWRCVKYVEFLLCYRLLGYKDREKVIYLEEGPLKVICKNGFLCLEWEGIPFVINPGLNVAVNTLGIWTDSTRAQWEILDKGDDYLRVKVTFQELPIVQEWGIRLGRGPFIEWEISMLVEEWLHIDEIRFVCAFPPYYKVWFSDYKEGYLSVLRDNWQEMCKEDTSTCMVGVRFAKDEVPLPDVGLEVDCSKNKLFPLVQGSPKSMGVYIVGLRNIISQEGKDFLPGKYEIFSGKVRIFNNPSVLDDCIEKLRLLHLSKSIERRRIRKTPKILLVNLPWYKNGKWGVRAGSRWPHIKDESEGNYLPFPFFLAYGASLLRRYGFDAEVLDAIAEELSDNEFMAKIKNIEFDYMVVETSVPSFFYDMGLLSRLSTWGIPIILCGPNVEIYSLSFMEKYKFINFVLFGEYEVTLLELMCAIRDGRRDFSSIDGLIWRDPRRGVIKNRRRLPFDINILPWPYRESLPMDKYWDLPGDIPHPSVQMVSSRGCPFGCNFCLWPQILFGGKTYRTRKVEDCIDEMEFLVRNIGFKSVYWDDDTFNIGKDRMLRFSREIIKRGLHNVPWAIMAKADLMDEEILDVMRQAGLSAVKYGIESASQELINKCGKGLNVKKAERIVKYTKKLGIKVHLTFSFGLPGETRDTIRRTIDYALYLSPDSIQFSIITPFPGTRLFDELKKEGRILTEDWSLYDGHHSCVFSPLDVSPEDLEQAKQYAYRVWADYQRRKRGLSGEIRRFLYYWKNYGFRSACLKAGRYWEYIIFHRKDFVKEIW